jgi:hypothetical protein
MHNLKELIAWQKARILENNGYQKINYLYLNSKILYLKY